MKVFFNSFVIFFLFNIIRSVLAIDSETDIVIVGGGTAGSVLAARLCVALPQLKIVVLEKGTTKKPKDEIYRKAIRLQFDLTRRDFVDQVETEPTLAFNQRKVKIPVGTGIGGATTINGGNLASATNNQYLKSFPYMTIQDIRRAKAMYRNQSRAGTLFPDAQEFAPILMKAVKDTNVKLVVHPAPETVPEDDRIYQETIFTRMGFRQSFDETYISPALAVCKNLRIITDAQVDRVESKRSAKGVYQAIGVHYIMKNTKRFMKVNQEIILSAGGVYTPPILHRSGFGEKSVLRRLGIKPLVDLQVGYFGNNIITMSFGEYKRAKGSRVNDPAYILSERSQAQFWAKKGGPLSSGVAGGGGEVLFSGSTCHFSITAETGLTGRTRLRPNDPGLLFAACMCPSDSKGKVEARSADPMAPPKIDLNFVNSKFDTDKVRQCAKLLSDIVKNLPPEMEAKQTMPSGGLENLERQNNTGSSYHLSGAAAVGRVLDKYYQVIGTHGLRVVDASAVPSGYRYGLFPATLLNAEHASRLIIEKHLGKWSK